MVLTAEVFEKVGKTAELFAKKAGDSSKLTGDLDYYIDKAPQSLLLDLPLEYEGKSSYVTLSGEQK